MKHINILFVLLVGIFGSTWLMAEHIKRYDVKSGIVTYEITHSGNMMGIKIQGKGEAKTVFKEWGNVELHSEQSQTTTMGHVEKTHELTKFDNGKVYVVDYGANVIYEYSPAMLAKPEYKDLVKTGKKSLKAMGGKKIGEEKFMGYECEVWEMMHVKLWLYKGLMLKSQADIMGMKHQTVAKDIKLNVSVSDSQLQLPKLPVKKASLPMMPDDEEKMPQLTPEQMQQMQEMMKSFSQRSER